MSFYKEVPGRKTTLESTLKFDTTPTAGSTSPVTSDGVATAITEAVGGASDALQEQIDDIAEKAGSGYIPKGEASVATLNGLSGQENGWLYTMTDAGTITDGSLAVVAGDTVAWDATNEVWYKAMDYAPRQYGTNEVHNLPTSITAFRTGDVIPVDGPSGTAKMSKDDLLRVTAENVAPTFFGTSLLSEFSGNLIKNNAIFVEGNVGDTITIQLTPATGWNTNVFPCSECEVFCLSGTGGARPKLWAFLDSDDKIVELSAQNLTQDKLFLCVPSSAAKLIVNFNGDGNIYKVVDDYLGWKVVNFSLAQRTSYYNNNGTWASDSSYGIYSYLIPVTNEKMAWIKSSSRRSRIAFFGSLPVEGQAVDIIGSELTIPSGESKYVLIPNGCQYVYVYTQPSQSNPNSLYAPACLALNDEAIVFNSDIVDSLLVNDANKVLSASQGYAIGKHLKYLNFSDVDDVITTTWTSGKAVDANSNNASFGNVKNSSVMSVSDQINVLQYNKLKMTVAVVPAATDYGYVFYGYDGTPIKGVLYSVESAYGYHLLEVDIPENAATLRISFPTSLISNFSCDGILESRLLDVEETANKAIENFDVKNEVEVNLSDFMNPDQTDDENIKDCLDFVRVFKNKKVKFDVASLEITKAILVDGGTTIDLSDCTIKQADNTFDNVFRSSNVVLDDSDYLYVPETISTIENIKLIGNENTIISGPDVNKTMEIGGEQVEMVGDKFGGRTHMLSFACVNNLEIANISFVKTRGWCCEFEFVANLNIHDIEVTSPNVKNGDGINVRGGCHNVFVKNISGATGDDSVVLNTHVPQNDNYPTSQVLYPNEFTYRYNINGCKNDPSFADIYNVFVDGVIKNGGRFHAFICLAGYDHKIHDVEVSGVSLTGTITASHLNADIAFYTYNNAFTEGDIYNIRLNDVNSNHSGGAEYVIVATVPLRTTWFNKLVQGQTGKYLTDLDNPDDVTITNSVVEE